MRESFIYSGQFRNKRKADIKEVLSKSSPAVVLTTEEGVLLITKNKSLSTEKVFNIYGKVSCAMIGDLNEIDIIRAELINESTTLGDLSYSPNEVTAEILSKAVSKLFKSAFDNFSAKPFYLEAIIAEAGENPGDDQIYKVSFDGKLERSSMEIIGAYKESDDGNKFINALNALKIKNMTNNTALQEITEIFGPTNDHKWEIKYIDRLKIKEIGEFESPLINIDLF